MGKEKEGYSYFSEFFSKGVERDQALVELALDLRWSWNHAADEIWRQLDPDLWERTRNPWVVLQTISSGQLKRMTSNPKFQKKVDELLQEKRQEMESQSWFDQQNPRSNLNAIAYFSMEFMLSEALPIYSGGLGNVAGDQLKSASDLGVPVIGVGLLYQQGYFRQMIDRYGVQQALYPYNDPVQLPIIPLREPNGEWLRLELAFPGYSVWLRAWQVQVGRRKLYLLDSNDPANYPAHRGITSELYGGGSETRLKQELVLGIGGWRLLRRLWIKPDVCHLNEGHAAFAVLERAYNLMEETGLPFVKALNITRAGNLFTTHTAVPAGFDRFTPDLIEQYLGTYATEKLGISPQELLALGRQNPDDHSENFNMAFLAIRGSGAVNGVSRLHGKVSRHLFQPLFPRWPENEVPVGHVTNGIHVPSWESAAANSLWSGAGGKERWRGIDETMEQNIHKLPDARIWQFRSESSKALVEYARERLSSQLTAAGASAPLIKEAKQIFNPDALTLGFGRRFATYKRPNLLLHDPDRLLRILSNPERPAQLILAGKAHPQDLAGQKLIQDWVRFIMQPAARSHIMFLSDYDMLLTNQLVQGVDVWINNPRRPWEACGTSGMKVLVNGGINLSELDGWWAEAYTPEVGWALGDGNEHGDDPAWDAAEATRLYDLLEYEVIPEFYDRNEKGIPTKWIARMRESMSQLTGRFSSNRAVRDYTEQYYLPAAKSYRKRALKPGKWGVEFFNWQQDLEQKWSGIQFGDVRVIERGTQFAFETDVDLNQVDPRFVQVELYAEDKSDSAPFLKEMRRLPHKSGEQELETYRATVPANRPKSDYTVRITPKHPDVSIPLEVNLIHWQK